MQERSRKGRAVQIKYIIVTIITALITFLAGNYLVNKVFATPTIIERTESNCIDQYCSNHHGKPTPDVVEDCDGELRYIKAEWVCEVQQPKSIPKRTPVEPISGK